MKLNKLLIQQIARRGRSEIWATCFALFILLLTGFASPSFAIQIYGHRGARGLSPENTIPAYQTALRIGVNYIDMDINMTKDGVLVVTHDMALNPNITRDAKGRWIKKPILIKALTFQQLEQYDVGEIKPGTSYAKLIPYQYPVPGTHIPSLKQVIDYVKKVGGDKINFQIEIKTDPRYPGWTFKPRKLAKALDNLLKEENIVNRCEIQAFDYRCLLALQKIDPNVATAYLSGVETAKAMRSSDPKLAGLWTGGHLLRNYNYSIPKMIKSLGGHVWGPQMYEVTPQLVKEAHQFGLKVVPWAWRKEPGVNVAMLIKMIDSKADGIITDRPDILRGLLAARGFNVPP